MHGRTTIKDGASVGRNCGITLSIKQHETGETNAFVKELKFCQRDSETFLRFSVVTCSCLKYMQLLFRNYCNV
jgi:hypothetical protein